jgi:hypothetical protein
MCPFDELLAEIFGDDAETVSSALRKARDEKLEGSSVGRRLVDLLDENGAEILMIIHTDDKLRAIVTEVLTDVADLIMTFQQGKRVTVEPSLVRRINAAARQLNRQASPQLKSAIRETRAVLRQFEGSTIPQGLKKAQTSS